MNKSSQNRILASRWAILHTARMCTKCAVCCSYQHTSCKGVHTPTLVALESVFDTGMVVPEQLGTYIAGQQASVYWVVACAVLACQAVSDVGVRAVHALAVPLTGPSQKKWEKRFGKGVGGCSHVGEEPGSSAAQRTVYHCTPTQPTQETMCNRGQGPAAAGEGLHKE